MSSIEPSETKDEKPTFACRLQSRIAVCRAPLWLTKATLPVRAMAPAKVAFRPLGGHMTPKQLGPTMRIFDSRAMARISCSSRAPSSPISLKPAEMTMAPRTPAAAHSRMTPGTAFAGVITTARSIGCGKAATFDQHFTPSTCSRFSLTGKIVPPKGLVSRFHINVRPTLPGRSLAPMTAMLRGAKNMSSAWRDFPNGSKGAFSSRNSCTVSRGSRRSCAGIGGRRHRWLADHQNGTVRYLKEPVRHAAHERAGDGIPAAMSDDHQLRLLVRGDGRERLRDGALAARGVGSDTGCAAVALGLGEQGRSVVMFDHVSVAGGSRICRG